MQGQLRGGARHPHRAAHDKRQEQPIRKTLIARREHGERRKQDDIQQAGDEDRPLDQAQREPPQGQQHAADDHVGGDVVPEEIAGPLVDVDMQFRDGVFEPAIEKPKHEHQDARGLEGQDDIAFHGGHPAEQLLGFGGRDFQQGHPFAEKTSAGPHQAAQGALAHPTLHVLVHRRSIPRLRARTEPATRARARPLSPPATGGPRLRSRTRAGPLPGR